MKEDPRKEKQVKEDETKDVGLNVSEDAGWARCPICNAIWDTGSMLGSWYFRWHVKDSDLPPAELPQKLCPEHVEEIVLAGRRKGIKRSLYQDQLNEIKKNGLHCPVCRSEDLQWENEMEVRTDFEEVVWTCNHCHAFIILGVRFKNEDENGELVYVFYREDLQTKELNEVWPEIVRIIESPGVKIG